MTGFRQLNYSVDKLMEDGKICLSQGVIRFKSLEKIFFCCESAHLRESSSHSKYSITQLDYSKFALKSLKTKLFP